MQVHAYLYFDGRCEEAIEFYRQALNAEVKQLMRFKDNPDPADGMVPPGAEEKVMHCALQIGSSEVFVSDGLCMGQPNFQGMALALTLPDADRAQQTFAALADGGQVRMPLAKTFFSPSFGMVADRFGVSWIVVTSP